MSRDVDSSMSSRPVGAAPDQAAARAILDRAGGSPISYCSGCGKPRGATIAKCLFCGNTDAVAPGPTPLDADSSRVDDVATAMLVEAWEPPSAFDDPKLDALYRKFGPAGDEAQAEFRRVLELLKGDVDARRVFARIIEEHLVEDAQEKSRPAGDAEPASEGGDHAWPWTVAVQPDAASADAELVDRKMSAMPHDALSPAAAVLTHALQGRWVPWLAAAIVVIAMSGAAMLMAPPTGPADGTFRQAVADIQRPLAQNGTMPREASAKETEIEATFTRAAAQEAARRQVEDASGPVEEEAAPPSAESRPDTQAELPTKPADQQSEAAMNLSNHDRMLVQAALTALGDEVPTTAYFGPITRAAITAWQKKQGLPETGFLDASQRLVLYAQAASVERKVEPTVSAAQQSEAAMNLSNHDRMLVQAALTALGDEVPTTAYFGPITRAAISAWQKRQGLSETGYLDAAELAALYAQGAGAERRAQPAVPDARQSEAAVNLSDQDRKRVQAALTLLGHDVPATGYFGPITRAAISAWQKTKGLPETGYLSDAQLATLQQQAAATLAKQDEAQIRSKDQRASR
jgi:peptidoglycan hydrolase-like protein with peptidoglycan-binding domain